MRLFEAIIDANHRAVAGDADAGLRPADFANELPVIALTCIDPRLNALFPNVLGLPGDQFIWLRNAGNIITDTLSSTMRSLALACAVKGGREIAIIGHTDCHVAKTTTTVLLDQLKALGVERSHLPANLSEFFGTFGSERQNVIKGCSFARSSPLIGPKIPVHGLLVDIETGKLEWVVNGYDVSHASPHPTMAKTDFATMGALGSFKDFDMGEMKFPEMKIGDAALPGASAAPAVPPQTSQPKMITVPPAIPPPLKKSPLPPIRMKPPLNPYKDFRRG
ncbi:MAG TPA: carbonic anhydrase [Verrucomicrobiae bacterium]|nr:carbonic anhydrase [Verrucomicrobiae bacterium]